MKYDGLSVSGHGLRIWPVIVAAPQLTVSAGDVVLGHGLARFDADHRGALARQVVALQGDLLARSEHAELVLEMQHVVRPESRAAAFGICHRLWVPPGPLNVPRLIISQ